MLVTAFIQNKWYYLLATAMLLFTLLDWDYGYYQILRWVIAGSAIYIAYRNYQSQSTNWTGIFVLIAILFNPISPIHLDREIWAVIDVIVAIVYLAAFYKDKNNTQELK